MTKSPAPAQNKSPVAAKPEPTYDTGSPHGIASKTSVGKAIWGVFTAIAGIPLAIAVTAVAGAAYLMVEGFRQISSHAHRVGFNSEKKIFYSPAATKVSNFLTNIIKGAWYNCGIYGYRKAAESIKDKIEDFQEDAGRGDASSSPSDREHLSIAAGHQSYEGQVDHDINEMTNHDLGIVSPSGSPHPFPHLCQRVSTAEERNHLATTAA